MNSFKKRLYIFLFFSICILILVFISLRFSYRILSKNHPVEASALVIEGWLPAYCLEQLAEGPEIRSYSSIFISGLFLDYPINLLHKNYTNNTYIKTNFIEMNDCGTLYFNSKAYSKIYPTSKITVITIKARGKKALGINAHIFLALKDSILDETFLQEFSQSYTFKCSIPANRLKEISICYNNDVVSGTEDRGVIIDSIFINHIFLTKRDIYFIGDNELGNKFRNMPFHSLSEGTAAYLRVLGVSQPIVLLDTVYPGRNRTLATANKFGLWWKSHQMKVKFNIVSMDGHSRRTYYTYKHVLPKNYSFGIISLQDYNFLYGNNHLHWKTIFSEEFALIIMYIQYLTGL